LQVKEAWEKVHSTSCFVITDPEACFDHKSDFWACFLFNAYKDKHNTNYGNKTLLHEAYLVYSYFSHICLTQ